MRSNSCADYRSDGQAYCGAYQSSDTGAYTRSHAAAGRSHSSSHDIAKAFDEPDCLSFNSATEYGYTDGESNNCTDCSAIHSDANSGPNGNTNHGAHRRSYFCPDGQADDRPQRAADAVSADY